jgi:hypothetical protein
MRSFAKPQMRSLAQRLMTLEAGGKNLSETKASAEFSVPDKLRPSLATLMGSAGFRALLSRALALAGTEVPWLHAVQVNADGTLKGLEELHAQLDPDEYFEGRVVLLSQLLGLLAAFIGENLTLGLVREVWPKLSVSDRIFKERNNEQAHQDE